MEFDEARPYQPGDEIRHLDWRVTARTGRAHTKLFREERERAVILWVDYRAPMFFATRGSFKSVLASQAAAMIAWGACNQGDRLGALIFSEQKHQELRPANGDRAVLNLIGRLAESSSLPPRASAPEKRREALLHALARVRRVTRPGALLFLLSDFRDLDKSAEIHLSALARHNELVLLRIHDRLEAELPTSGQYPVSDGYQRLSLQGADRKLHQRYSQQNLDRQDYLGQLCQRYRMHLLHCSTDCDLGETLAQGLGRRVR